MLSKHQKHFFLVSGFWWLILIFKICGKTYLKINWSVKTSLYRRHKGAACSELKAPVEDDEITTAKVVFFCVYLIWCC